MAYLTQIPTFITSGLLKIVSCRSLSPVCSLSMFPDCDFGLRVAFLQPRAKCSSLPQWKQCWNACTLDFWHFSHVFWRFSFDLVAGTEIADIEFIASHNDVISVCTEATCSTSLFGFLLTLLTGESILHTVFGTRCFVWPNFVFLSVSVVAALLSSLINKSSELFGFWRWGRIFTRITSSRSPVSIEWRNKYCTNSWSCLTEASNSFETNRIFWRDSKDRIRNVCGSSLADCVSVVSCWNNSVALLRKYSLRIFLSFDSVISGEASKYDLSAIPGPIEWINA